VRSPSKSPRSLPCPEHSLVISAKGIQSNVRQLLAAQCSEMFSSNKEWNSSEDTFSLANKKNYNRANTAISKDVPTPFFHLETQKHFAEYAMWKDTLTVQRSTCPVEGLGYLHEHGYFDLRFWKRRFVTISNISHLSSQRCVCFWAVTERRKRTKYCFSITSTQTIKQNVSQTLFETKAAESLVTSSNRLHASHR